MEWLTEKVTFIQYYKYTNMKKIKQVKQTFFYTYSKQNIDKCVRKCIGLTMV